MHTVYRWLITRFLHLYIRSTDLAQCQIAEDRRVAPSALNVRCNAMPTGSVPSSVAVFFVFVSRKCVHE